MKLGAPAAAVVFVASVSGCVHSHRTISIPNGPVGELVHTEAGAGTLSIEYAGKRYTGQYVSEPSRYIQGKRRYHSGRIARPTLIAPSGEKMVCDIQWGSGIDAAGFCEDANGQSFYVRFE
jgi:hypothetical protein